jgi:hypothetical protein
MPRMNLRVRRLNPTPETPRRSSKLYSLMSNRANQRPNPVGLLAGPDR